MNKFMPVSARKLRLLTKKTGAHIGAPLQDYQHMGRTHRCAPTRLPTYGAKLISVSPNLCRLTTLLIYSIKEKRGKQMELELIFKIAAVGIIVAVLVQLLKRAERDEQAMMTTLAGLIVVLMMIIQRISELFDTVKTLFGF